MTPLARADLRERLGALARASVTPLLPEDYLDLVAPLRSGASLKGRIVAVQPETRDAVSLMIRPGRDWQPHIPGQYLRLGIDVDGVRRWRAYSLTSMLDRPDGLISVTVKALEGGLVSTYLVRRARPGMLVHLEQPAGDFSIPVSSRPDVTSSSVSPASPASPAGPDSDVNSDSPVGPVGTLSPGIPVGRVGLGDPSTGGEAGTEGIDATGTLTGSESGLERRAWAGPERESGPDTETETETETGSILFVTAGSGLTPVMGMLRNGVTDDRDVVVLHSAPTADDVLFGGELRTMAARGQLRLIEQHTDTEGLLSVADLPRLVPDLAERRTYACGPVGLLDALERFYADTGLTQHLYTERFRAAIVAVGEGGEVTFARSQTQAYGAAVTPLLEVGENAGLLMPSGCRMGICFGCVIGLREGAVRDLRDGTVTTATDDPVLIQTCISAAAGPCQLDV